MSEDYNQKNFAELLESFDIKSGSELKVGDKVQGKIINVSQDKVYIDTGAKTDGVAEKETLLDKHGDFPYQEGDRIELFVVSCRYNEIRLGPSLAGGGPELLQEALDKGMPVEGTIKEICKGGYRVKVMGQTAFCPFSQMDIRPVEDSESLIGQSKSFLINRVEEGGRNIVISRRALLEKERAESLQSFIERTSPGDVLQGTVTKVQSYGAFVQVAPGLEGMVHISELSWSKTLAPEELVSPGESVRVKLLSIKEQEKGGPRIELSMKQTEADPWQRVAEKFKPDTLVKGTVTKLADFGVFVEIAPGIEGLVHISEMSYIKRVHKPEDEVSVGDQLAIVIKEIDPESKRISLSMRDAEGDPWLGLEERYHKGQKVQGVVKNKENYGLFVQLEPGVVGLVPKSKLERSLEVTPDKIKSGETFDVILEEIDQENRRITLTPADATTNGDWKSYASSAGEGLGSLGEKLRQAMERKK
ncbi:MAG TPA: S1 RNA-binding domain-containing protein [Desulfohalobiaceae bacterium]|nr:S1 RNA-binding domain-containing protein [Desulfohalobiaceae bacterium]